MARIEPGLKGQVSARWVLETAPDNRTFDTLVRLGVRIGLPHENPQAMKYVIFKETTTVDDIIAGLLSLAEGLEALK